MSYVVQGGGETTGSGEEAHCDEADAPIVISNKLIELGQVVEKAIENDPDIREQDKNVIEGALSSLPTGPSMNMQLLKQHLVKIFRNSFSRHFLQNCE